MLIAELISFHSALRSGEGSAGKVGRGCSVGLVKPCREWDFDPGPTWPLASWGRPQQISHVHQIVGPGCPGEHPSDSFQASKPRLPHPGRGLEAARDFFHPLAFRPGGRVACMPGGPLINRAARPSHPPCHVPSDLQLAQRRHLLVGVIILVPSQSDSPSLPLAPRRHRLQRGLPFGGSRDRRQSCLDHQAVFVFHPYVVEESPFWPPALSPSCTTWRPYRSWRRACRGCASGRESSRWDSPSPNRSAGAGLW